MQSKSPFRVSILALTASALAFACSSNDSAGKPTPDASTGTGGAAGDSGSGGGTSTGGGSAGDAGKCDVTLAPSTDDLKTVQEALDTKVKSGNTVCFSPGTYKFGNHVALAKAQKVTFRGTGAKPEDVLFDFTEQTAGSEGVLVTTDDFTIENLWIKNTQGNGIKVQADRSVFRGIKVSWEQSAAADGGTHLSGAYAIYPTICDHTLLENNEVSGASDAGIYAGQCKHVIARNNHAHHNVLGIEIENTIGAEVYGNDVHDNSTGMLLDLLQNLSQTTSTDYLVHDNDVHDNNLANFAESHKGQAADAAATALITIAPQGTGILVLSPKNVEIRNNKLRNNGGVPLIIVSQDTADVIVQARGGTPQPPDPATSRYPTEIYVHDNTFTNNGTNPQDVYALVAPTDGGKPFNPYDVQWDGATKAGTTDADAKICLGKTDLPTFVNFHTPAGLLGALSGDHSKWTTDTTAHQCTLPPVAPLTP
jgi:parallel beta-helix repeat protein